MVAQFGILVKSEGIPFNASGILVKLNGTPNKAKAKPFATIGLPFSAINRCKLWVRCK